ncbi:hypothetical protein BDZ97DRAFT_1759888 [Flammula alnicola]|nr:hypothetical protein BDZ97DRAFT_1759888 [Flammula alnicola]
MDTIILQDITLQPKLADLSEDARFVAQLLMDDLVFEETEVVGKGPTDPFWNLRGTFLVPANADYFTISIFKVSGSEERSHLVAIEISSAQIVENSGDHKISVRIQLTKLDEEPIADLGFSVGLSTSNYAARSSPDNVIQVVRSLDREGIILLLTQVTLSDSSCINADLGLLNAMYGVVFRLPNERIDKSRALCLLANIHVARYDTYLTIAGDDAINHPMYEIYSIGLKSSLHMLEDAVHLAADDHPKKSWLLISFSMCLQRSMLQQVNHSEKFGVLALKLLEVAPLLPDEEPKKPILLNYIGVALGHRFTQYNDLLDLNNSIAVLEDAVRLTPDDDIAYKASFLNDLSDSLSRRFEKLHVPRDKSRSLLLRETALRLMPDGDPQKPVLLNFLGHAFFLRSEEFSDLDLTNRSIQSYETALLLIGDDHSEKSSILNNLSSSLQLRFKQLDVFANPEDLRRIQQGLEDAVHLSAEGDPNKLSYTINLGKFFLFHFGKLADIVSVERCVSILEDATHLAATADIDKVLLLNDFGQSLFIHSDELTKLNHINEVLILCEAAARLIPDDQPNKLGVLDRLGAALSRRFDQERERSHIDKTIVIYEDAVRLTADNNLQKPIRLNHLGEAYLKRFEHFNELDDVDKSISLSQEAVTVSILINLSTMHKEIQIKREH